MNSRLCQKVDMMLCIPLYFNHFVLFYYICIHIHTLFSFLSHLHVSIFYINFTTESTRHNDLKKERIKDIVKEETKNIL